jgi:predicted metal-dependent enzyme (double-stranded beta helix superfamily)
MFDLDRFVEDCRAALPGGQAALREIVGRAVSEPDYVIRRLGEPTRAGLHVLHHTPELTVLNLVWGPYMSLQPHDHRMAAVIGIYTGREDNIFWRRLPGGRVEAAGAQALAAQDCTVLGKDIVHSVVNPIPRLTGALHVYAGDFFGAERSEWDAETLEERPYDAAGVRRRFEESNAMMAQWR